MTRAPRPYADPHVAGVALGLVLLAAYVLAGRGLGASGAFNAVAARAIAAAAPGTTSPWVAERVAAGGLLDEWLVPELAGAMLGALASAALAGRLQATVERGAGITVGPRLAAASLGGAAMGAGAVLARGCTSGQALTGGALLSAGSWLFVAGAFGAGFLAMVAAGRLWR